MGRIWMPGGGGGTDLDVVTALADDVIQGKVIVGPDGEPLTGTLALSGDAGDSMVLSRKTYYNTDPKQKRTGTMANQGAKTAALNCGGSYTIPAGYHNGSGKVTANSLASQTAGNAGTTDIRNGKTAFVNGNKVTGSMTERGAITITPSTKNQTIAANQFLTGIQTIKGDSNLVAGNILNGKTIFGIAGNVRKYGVFTQDIATSGSKSFKDGQGTNRSLYYLSFAPGFTPLLIVACKAGEGRTFSTLTNFGPVECSERTSTGTSTTARTYEIPISSGIVLTAGSVIFPVAQSGTYGVKCVGYY